MIFKFKFELKKFKKNIKKFERIQNLFFREKKKMIKLKNRGEM
jgi:hypothetical protein